MVFQQKVMEETTTENANWILHENTTESAKWILHKTTTGSAKWIWHETTESAKWILHDISYRGINFTPSNWREKGGKKNSSLMPCHCYWTNYLAYFLSQVWFLREARDFPLQSVLTGSSNHSASCSVGSRVKVARAYSWPQSSARVRLNGVIPLLLRWHLINHRERGPLQCSSFNAYCAVLNNVSITKIPTAFNRAKKHIKVVAVLIVPINYLAWKWITFMNRMIQFITLPCWIFLYLHLHCWTSWLVFIKTGMNC